MDNSDIFRMRASGNLTDGLLDFIAAIPDTKTKAIVEVGAWIGEATVIFAQHFRHVTCVDPWSMPLDPAKYKTDIEGVFQRFRRNTKPYNNVGYFRDYSLNAARSVRDESIDVVYIDARHEYNHVKDDIAAWLPKVKRGGCISGHDYCEQFPGVIQAVTEAFGEVQTFVDGSWLKRKE